MDEFKMFGPRCSARCLTNQAEGNLYGMIPFKRVSIVPEKSHYYLKNI